MAWLDVRRQGGGGTSALVGTRRGGAQGRGAVPVVGLSVEELRFCVKGEASSDRGRTEADLGVGQQGGGSSGVDRGRR
jgi:hypothetical protein